MSHEIRTPMNAILGQDGAAAPSATGLDAGQQDLLGASTPAGNHLLAIINDILDISKIGPANCTWTRSIFSGGAVQQTYSP